MQNLLEIVNFRVVFANRYYDENDLFIICQKQDKKYHKQRIMIDNYKKVISFFVDGKLSLTYTNHYNNFLKIFNFRVVFANRE